MGGGWSVKPSYIMPHWWTYVVIHLSKSREHTTRVNPNVNHGLGVITMYPCRF